MVLTGQWSFQHIFPLVVVDEDRDKDEGETELASLPVSEAT